MTQHDSYAFRYLTTGGTNTTGPACKNWACAVLSLKPIDPTLVDAVVINGEAHLLGEPVPAMRYLLQNHRVALGMRQAIDAAALASEDDVPDPATNWADADLADYPNAVIEQAQP